MKKLLIFGLALMLTTISFAQVGIGTTTPAPSSILELSSANKALLVTRVANEEAIANPVNGMIIYDIELKCIRSYQNGVWSDCISSIAPAVLTIDCASALTSGTLTAGISASGVTVTVPYTGGNAGSFPGQIVSSTGVTGLSAVLQAGTLATGAGNEVFTIIGVPSAAGTASFTITIGAESCTFNVPVVAGGPQVTALNCAGATSTGTLTANTSASGVFVSVPYTGGNGVPYSSQIISSTGVTGLTAFINSGTLTDGAGGTLIFSITGLPATNGVATFSFSLGGQSCTFNLNVQAQPAVATFSNCSTASSGTLTQGQSASGVTQTATYTGGNGGNYPATSIASSDVAGLTANLAAGTLVAGGGTLVFTITGNPTSSGTARFNVSLFGTTCFFTRTVDTPTANATLSCGTATFSPSTLVAGVAYSGTLTVPYTGGNGGSYGAGGAIASTGVTGLSATLQAGTLTTGSGNLTYTVTGTPATTGTANFNFGLVFGTSSCTVTGTVTGPTVSALTCGSAVFNPTGLTVNTAYSGTFTVPYTGGNGAPYAAGTGIGSTGVTGLTATLQAGTLAVGSGNLTYTVTGTPTTSGTATFAISFGSQSCNVTRTVSAYPSTLTTTTTNTGVGGHLPASYFPYLYDDILTYTAQDVPTPDMLQLRVHQDGKDIIRTVFNTTIPAGGTIRISWSRREQVSGLGMIAELYSGATLSQAAVNTLTNVMPNATQTNVVNDMTLIINITAAMNTLIVKSSQDGVGPDPILMEIEVFDPSNNKIPIN